jgi:hypothetical protein
LIPIEVNTMKRFLFGGFSTLLLTTTIAPVALAETERPDRLMAERPDAFDTVGNAFDDAVDWTEEAVDDTGAAIDAAAEDTGEAVNDAADWTEEAAEDTGAAVDDAADATDAAAEDTGEAVEEAVQ